MKCLNWLKLQFDDINVKKGVLKNFAKFTGVSCEFSEISKKTFCYGTPPVAASVCGYYLLIFRKVLCTFFILTKS